MKEFRLRIVCVCAATLQLVWFFLPLYEYVWLTQDELVILGYSAFGARIPVGSTVAWIYLLLSLAMMASVFVFGRHVRHIFLVFVLVALLGLVPLGGMVIETGPSATIRDVFNILLGVIVAMTYTTRHRGRTD